MEVDPPIFNHEFLAELGDKSFSRRSFQKWERISHSCGATIQEVFILRHGKFKRTVDVIIFPDNTDQVEVSLILFSDYFIELSCISKQT
jgi:alkyldihydroxyacetonephosphate synthase